MVALDDSGVTGARFDDIRVNRTLRQEVDSADFTAFVFKYADKFFADNLALPFRFADAASFDRKRSDASTRIKFMPEPWKVRFDFVAFVFTHEAVVDEDTGQLAAYGFRNKAAATELSTPPDRPVRPCRHRRSA